ncbi:cysteine--tRNA ligase [Prosthecochloris sp. N3]|uniref:Cysteine--tRNA ligase n=1 Tax=Prosthecochloris ethylica TaxID=2743976 RepID=A0ABR9XNZ2_9CHLB|nr:cysteine--tRNA ligase [Prosthecochloris ethylica]MBF0585836.1 cysteine--tRNA ligase [Prosthecochloris ethylica]MBF0635746.1 cysteine--tRNA ligase [Prosthecochloris ethylica]NUK47044.1 cysteine--tRNA ligase [Prosthecochloris ethylica]
MPLKIYNSLTRSKEEFTPLHPGQVTMYVCGPTVYGHAHLGHAKSYVSFDVVLKWLRHLGYRVTYIQNITDVGHLTDDADEGEDKIARQARREQTDPMEIAQLYTRSYYEDMDRLGVDRPNIAPTATGHIPDQIALIRTLIEKGHAYEVNGNVYFSVESFPGYGKLSGRTTDDARQPGGRVEARSEKRHPADFALWKKAEPGHLMKWESPWSEGYPGWHAECSAMAMKYLGETIDIHGGGMENKFPHHECEIAQSEAATGHPYVRYWMHNNMVTVDGTKMGKSLGNFINLKDIFNEFEPIVIRFFILQSHYRSPLDFSHQAVKASQTGLEKLRESWLRLTASAPGEEDIDTDAYENRLVEAMNDDFNTPVALAVLFDLSKAINTALDSGGLKEEARNDCIRLFSTFGIEVLGILDNRPNTVNEASTSIAQALEGAMSLLLDIRQKARQSKDYETSDLIRDRLDEAGITIKDTREGAEWKLG